MKAAPFLHFRLEQVFMREIELKSWTTYFSLRKRDATLVCHVHGIQTSALDLGDWRAWRDVTRHQRGTAQYAFNPATHRITACSWSR